MNIENLIVCLVLMLLAIALTGWWLNAHSLSTAWFEPESLKAQIENLPLVKTHVRNKDGVWEEKELRMAADEFIAFTMAARKFQMLAWSTLGSIALVCFTIVTGIALSLGATSKQDATEPPKDRFTICVCCHGIRSCNDTSNNVDSRPATNLARPVPPPGALKPAEVSNTPPAISAVKKLDDIKTP